MWGAAARHDGPRDSEPAEPFQIIGRPWIDREGDFRLHRAPGACGRLAEYLDDMPGVNRGGGAPAEVRDAKSANLELLRQWLAADPLCSSAQLAQRFREAGIDLNPSSIRRYRKELAL